MCLADGKFEIWTRAFANCWSLWYGVSLSCEGFCAHVLFPFSVLSCALGRLLLCVFFLGGGLLLAFGAVKSSIVFGVVTFALHFRLFSYYRW